MLEALLLETYIVIVTGELLETSIVTGEQALALLLGTYIVTGELLEMFEMLLEMLLLETLEALLLETYIVIVTGELLGMVWIHGCILLILAAPLVPKIDPSLGRVPCDDLRRS